jgi:hypothetical protein
MRFYSSDSGDEAEAEREAIQWLESMPDAEAQDVIDAAIAEFDSITGCDAETCEQSEQSEQSLVEPSPCAKCGSISCWWDGLGSRHCDQCDPPVRSQFIANRCRELLADYAANIFPVRYSDVDECRRHYRKYHEPQDHPELEADVLQPVTHELKPKACAGHKSPDNWQWSDSPAGWRASCRLCGGFVGYEKRMKTRDFLAKQ